ncbi:MAG: hypothetical protein JST54_14775 [Deltaproteobacteria bacterium]|nr:hypothetical protein [Deltaproteobacteria bacterium]
MRLHLFELEDQPWFPAPARDAGTAYLELSLRVSGQAKLLAPTVVHALEESGQTEIVDLCSGGGGPWGVLAEELAALGKPFHLTFTDRYPNAQALDALVQRDPAHLSFRTEPVDATRVPPDLRGLRTVVNAFHHFRPDEAKGLLQSARDAREPIFVLEFASRSPAFFFGVLLGPLITLFAVPFLRGLRASWLALTYLFPLVPFLVGWDGLVSALRVYSVPELEAMTRGLAAPGYRWSVGQVRLGKAPAYATYVLGVPER